MGKSSRAHHQDDGHGLCPLPILRLMTTTHLKAGIFWPGNLLAIAAVIEI
jgi:hypothetical protein